jgi:hypothetical protein
LFLIRGIIFVTVAILQLQNVNEADEGVGGGAGPAG